MRIPARVALVAVVLVACGQGSAPAPSGGGSAAAAGADTAAALGDCLDGQAATWRFAIPKDADGEATDASFVITLQLVPD